MPDRREVIISGAAVFAMTAKVEARATAIRDPVPGLWRELQALHAFIDRQPRPPRDQVEEACTRIGAIDGALLAGESACTLAGALAALEWARFEYLEMSGGPETAADDGPSIMLTLLDGALSVVRTAAAADQAR